jgi:glycosyltransferase involved in cell wall biosynthesis
MKILYFVTQGEQGGAQKYVADLANGILTSPLTRLRGVEVFVATGIQKESKDKWLFETLENSGVKKDNLFEIKNHVREISLVKDFLGLLDLIKIIRKVKPDVLHTNSSKAGLIGAIAGFLTRTKTVFTVHGFFFLEPMGLPKKVLFIFIEFFSSLLRSFTILISEKDILVGKKFWILRNTEKFKLIYNGVDDKLKENILDKESARKYIFEKIGIQDNAEKIIGTIANLYRTKGLEYFIDSAKLVLDKKPNTLFVVLGFGEESYRKELEEKILANGLSQNFFLLGRTPFAYRYLKAFDLFTLTSVKEGLPYTLLEAKMAGVKIVATKVGGIEEMSKSFEITLAEPKNSKDISDKFLESLEKNQDTDNSLPKIFHIDNMLNETLAVYEKVL